MTTRGRSRRQVNIHEAKTSLSKLVERVEAGEEIVIARAGTPVAKLVAFTPRTAPRRLGPLNGRFKIPDDFNRPLPESILKDFEGSE
jgi:prevent-host-death family protein